MKRPATKLAVTALEDRLTPALTGLPWADPSHLTMSYVPDGTNVGGTPSQLFAKLNTQMPTATWQAAIAEAVQAWVTISGTNVGVVSDTGAAFGSPGPTQGDARFGDIRIAATPMALTTYAEAVPPDPYLSGTFAGDIVLNSNVTFTPSLLKAVVLHEMGHALGLAHSTDPLSVMYRHLNTVGTLAASDITAARGLYGIRINDLHEGSNGNGSLNTATQLDFEGDFEGQIPMVQWGDITNPIDVDYFKFDPPSSYSGPATFRLQTSGISLLAPKISVLNQYGTTLLTASAATADGATLAVTLPSVNPNNQYFVKVEAAAGTIHTVGRYGIAITADNLLQSTALQMSIDQVLRGPFETIDDDTVAMLFLNPSEVLINDDFHTDDSASTAQLPYFDLGFAANTVYRLAGSLKDAADIDFYRVKSPATTGPWALSVTLAKFGPNGLVPRVQVLDANLVPLPFTILANGNGRFAVQVTGIAANRDIYLKVLPNGTIGNYSLEARFKTVPVTYAPITQGTLTAEQSSQSMTLRAFRPTLLGLALSATGGPVRLTITPLSGGAPLLDMTAAAGDTITGLSTLLPAGSYTLTLQTIAGGALPAGFVIRGNILTDPVGPKATDPTATVTNRKRTAPKDTVPANTISTIGVTILDPFLWLVQSLS